MARRKNNAKRTDGRYAVQVYLGRDYEGKRIIKTVYGRSQADANSKAQELKDDLGKGTDIRAAEKPFKFFAEKWLAEKKLSVSVKTHNAQLRYVSYLNECIAHKTIAHIVRSDIAAIITAHAESNPHTGKPSSKKHLSDLLGAARQIFDYARNDRVIEFNPCDGIELPKTSPPIKRRALTDTEQQWVLNTEHRAKTAAMIMMYAGLRRGELIPLLWSDIDLDNATIEVNKSVERSSARFTVKHEAKTSASLRTIEIPQVLVEYLHSVPRKSILVCTSVQGTMHTDISWRRMWESYLKEINRTHGNFTPFQNKPLSKYDPKGTPFVIEPFTAHMLRHTFCTLLYFAGVDILTARNQMGHADIKVTLGIYTHLDEKHKRKSM